SSDVCSSDLTPTTIKFQASSYDKPTSNCFAYSSSLYLRQSLSNLYVAGQPLALLVHYVLDLISMFFEYVHDLWINLIPLSIKKFCDSYKVLITKNIIYAINIHQIIHNLMLTCVSWHNRYTSFTFKNKFIGCKF